MPTFAPADLGIVAAAGALGVMMVRLDWPRPPLLLGLALGGLAENRLFLATSLYGWTWILRPGVGLIALVTLVALVLPMILRATGRGRVLSQMAADTD